METRDEDAGGHEQYDEAEDDEVEDDDDEDQEEGEDELPEPARRRKVWLVAVLVIAALVLGGIGYVRYQSIRQRADAARIGDVAIGPNMTLADLRHILGPETSADTAVDSGLPVNNELDFEFGHGMVVATFLGKEPSAVPGRETTIKITVMPSFRGTVCGVRTTDPLPGALSILHANYPASFKTNDYDTDHEVNLDGVWALAFNPREQDGHLSAGGMILQNTNWFTAGTDPGP